MTLLTCCADGFRTLSRAAAKATSARLREMGWGRSAANWSDRAAACERCPLRVIRNNVSYCGQPLLAQINRELAADGCGCPAHAKAKDPAEHCPLDAAHQPARRIDGACNCKWCRLSSADATRPD